jgi:hypothetical protein
MTQDEIRVLLRFRDTHRKVARTSTRCSMPISATLPSGYGSCSNWKRSFRCCAHVVRKAGKQSHVES